MLNNYKFEVLNRRFPFFENKKISELFEKWDLKLRFFTFSFNPHLHLPYQDFLQQLFDDVTVQTAVSAWVPALSWNCEDRIMKIESITTSITSMTFFDRLMTSEVVRESGSIRKCFHEMQDGILICDELRKMLLVEDSENFEMFDEAERNEMIFQLFRTFVIGGRISQYEDQIDAYFDVTKSVYKDLVCVQKVQDSNDLKVISKIFKVSFQNKKTENIFPPEHEQNFIFVIIDPLKRHTHLMLHLSDF